MDYVGVDAPSAAGSRLGMAKMSEDRLSEIRNNIERAHARIKGLEDQMVGINARLGGPVPESTAASTGMGGLRHMPDGALASQETALEILHEGIAILENEVARLCSILGR